MYESKRENHTTRNHIDEAQCSCFQNSSFFCTFTEVFFCTFAGVFAWVFLDAVALYSSIHCNAMHCRTMGANTVYSETLFYTLMESAVCILGWQYTVFFLRHHCSLWIGIMYSWMEAHVSMTRGVSQGRVDSSTLTLEIPAESLQ